MRAKTPAPSRRSTSYSISSVALSSHMSSAESTPKSVALTFAANFKGGNYVEKDGERESFTRENLISLASSGPWRRP